MYQQYIQSVIDHINLRMKSTDLISAISLFDPHHLSSSAEMLTELDYGTEKLKTLISQYGIVQKAQFEGAESFSVPDIEAEETSSEWKLFRQVLLLRNKGNSLQHVLLSLVDCKESSFPNLSHWLQS